MQALISEYRHPDNSGLAPSITRLNLNLINLNLINFRPYKLWPYKPGLTMSNPAPASRPPIILASSSSYRRNLLLRLGLEFDCVSPDIDETPLAGEAPQALAARLATSKACAVAERYPAHLIIASDQTALCDDIIVDKPGDHRTATKQLQRYSGKTLTFYTGLCVYNGLSQQTHTVVEPFSVTFRTLSTEQIERYLQAEQPYDCAGSFKMEGLGISLFEKLAGDDPNSLIGLPLIKLVRLLASEGIALP